MSIIKTKSLGKEYAEVQEITLDETPKTRTVFKPYIHSGGVRGEIVRYKKDKATGLETVGSTNFNEIKVGEGIRIELNTKALGVLEEGLKKVKAVQIEKGVIYGTNEYKVVNSEDIVIDDRNKARVIKQLLEGNYAEDFWYQLEDMKPDLSYKLAYSKIQEERIKALDTFACMMADDSIKEKDWQDFFEENTWIFGYGLRYQILRVLAGQPDYGGRTYIGDGGQRGDFLTVTEAETKYTCLVEIKKPNTKLLQNRQYRNGAWGVSAELAGAVSQIQVNCAQWEMDASRTDRNRELLKDFYTIAPKGIVVIGSTSELNDYEKKNSFGRFRSEIRNPEIITYDELYERAKFIVGGDTKVNQPDDYDVPF